MEKLYKLKKNIFFIYLSLIHTHTYTIVTYNSHRNMTRGVFVRYVIL